MVYFLASPSVWPTKYEAISGGKLRRCLASFFLFRICVAIWRQLLCERVFFVILNIFSNSFFHSRGAQVVENLKNFSFAHIFDKNVNANAKKPV